MSIIRGQRTYGSARPPSALRDPSKSAVIGKVEGKVPFRGFLLIGLAVALYVAYSTLAQKASEIAVAVEDVKHKLDNLEDIGLPPPLQQVVSDIWHELSGPPGEEANGARPSSAPRAQQGNDTEAASSPEAGVETKALAAAYEQGRLLANAGKFSAAMAVWRPLAEKGHAESIFSIGRLYARGDGVQKDYRKAREHFLNAAKLGSASAFHALGLMYQNGDGVPRDVAKAKSYYEEAARRGHPAARNALSSLERKAKP